MNKFIEVHLVGVKSRVNINETENYNEHYANNVLNKLRVPKIHK